MVTHSIKIAEINAPNVPTTYPNIANNAPTGAKLGLNAPATTGADAAPPILALLPTAMKKNGAFINFATANKITTCTNIQTIPKTINNGLSKICIISILIPITATKM